MVPIARWIAEQFCVLAHVGRPFRPPHSIFKNPTLCRDALRRVRSGQSPALSHKTPAFAHSIFGVISLIHWITQVEVDGDYGLKLRFQDGSLRRVNLRDHLDGAMFAPLKDPQLFRTARLNPDIDTVVWDNGADMSPDFLREISTPA